jgi:hypothetical protein
METLAQMIKDAVADVGDDDEVSFYNAYGGRGMYGRKCVGVVGSERACNSIVGAVIKSLMCSVSAAALSQQGDLLADKEHDFERAVDILMHSSKDSMGRSDIILYWEQLEALPFDEPEHDGQPDEAQEWHDFDPEC